MCSSLNESLILYSWRNQCWWMFCTQSLSRDIRSAVGKHFVPVPCQTFADQLKRLLSVHVVL